MTVARLTEASDPATGRADGCAARPWYNANKQRFTQPTAGASPCWPIPAEDFLDRVELTDEQVKAEYEKRIRDYSTPETREIAEFTPADRNAVHLHRPRPSRALRSRTRLAACRASPCTDRSVKMDEVTDERYRGLVFGLTAGKVRHRSDQAR